MRIGITGATGAIGKCLVKGLVKKYPKALLFLYDSKNLDIRERIEFPELDYLYHLAAISGIFQCSKDIKKCYDVNVNGTDNVVKAAEKIKVKRIIYSSTIVVLPGRGEVSPYKSSKILAELKVREVKFSYTVLRIASPYGEGIEKGPWYDIKHNRMYLHPASVINFVPIEKVVDELVMALDDNGNFVKNVFGEDKKIIDLCTEFGYKEVRR